MIVNASNASQKLTENSSKGFRICNNYRTTSVPAVPRHFLDGSNAESQSVIMNT